MFFLNQIPQIQLIDRRFTPRPNVSLSVLREDELHPFVSGNKFRKLKYIVQDAKTGGFNTLLTFGGAYSNHIAAVAAAGAELGFKTIGVIRGDELAVKVGENPTLRFARQNDMQLDFISRASYKMKTNSAFIESLHHRFGDFYLIPEGGTGTLAVKGCEEILGPNTSEFDIICVSVGTGGTISGIINASESHQHIIGFSALKGTFQHSEIEKYTTKENFELKDAYSFGGYGKIDSTLVRFINEFKKNTGIPLDPIYTGKMMYGIYDLIKKGKFKENSRILAIHTGGLQGIAGMNQKLKQKRLPQIV